jgi:hypothetical protein
MPGFQNAESAVLTLPAESQFLKMPPRPAGSAVSVGKGCMTRLNLSGTPHSQAAAASKRDKTLPPLAARTPPAPADGFVPVGRGRYAGPVLQLGFERTADLPLCSFGPGGAYVIDWQVQQRDLSDARRRFPPRTLGSMVRRVAGLVLWDLKGWLVAVHPGREYRIDRRPEALEPCGACGHSALWPRWLVEGRAGPLVDQAVAAVAATASDGRETTIAPVRQHDAAENMAGDSEAFGARAIVRAGASEPPNPRETPSQEPQEPTATAEKPADDVPANYPFPFDCHGSSELEPVREFGRSPAGRLIARLTADSRDGGTMRLFENDDLVPGGSFQQEATAAPVANCLGNGGTPSTAQRTEMSHDTYPQATQNPHRDPRLPASQRVLPDDAGVGRSTRRLKGHDLRARRGARKETTPASCPEQGSLFGGLADGEAA